MHKKIKMKIIYNFLLLLFLFVCNYNNFVNGQFTAITTNSDMVVSVVDTQPIYSLYPGDSSGSKVCSFEYNLLVENKEVGGSITSFTSSSDLLSKTAAYLNLLNLTVYKLTNQSIPLGASKTITLTAISKSNINVQYKIDLKCNDFNHTSIKVNFVEDKIWFLLNSGYTSTIQVNGITTPILKLDVDSTVGKVKTLAIGKNTFLLTWNWNYLKANYGLQLYTIVVYIGTKNYTIQTKSCFDFSSQPSNDIKFYPNNVLNTSTVIEEFGYGMAPIIKSKQNSGFSAPLQYLENSMVATQNILPYIYTYPFIISGTKNNFTIDHYLYDAGTTTSGGPDGITPINYDLYEPNGLTLYRVDFSVTIKKFLAYKIIEAVSLVYSENQIAVRVEASIIQKYSFNQYYYAFATNRFTKGAPFGLGSGTCSSYINKVSFPANIASTAQFYYYNFYTLSSPVLVPPSYSINVQNQTLNNTKPYIASYEFKFIPNSFYVILSIRMVSVNGFAWFRIGPNNVYVGIETMVSGTVYDGIFEIKYDCATYPQVSVYDIYGNFVQYDLGSFITLNPPTKFITPPTLSTYYDPSVFENITFEYNDLYLLNNPSYNRLYLNSSILPTNQPMALVLLDPISFVQGGRDYEFLGNVGQYNPIIYNSTLNLFTCDFIVPKNNIFDEIKYAIYYSPTISGGYSAMIVYSDQLKSESSKLRVNVTTLDAEGPMFSNIEKIGEATTISKNNNKIGWKITIKDETNGFSNGYIKVMGYIDASIIEFNFTDSNLVSGNKFNGIYDIVVNVSTTRCISQEYVITTVLLYDTNKVVSRFDLYSQYPNPTANPFKYFVGNTSINRVSFVCEGAIDISPPKLLSFIASKSTINVRSLDRTIYFNFEAQDLDSGIRVDQNPIVYITGIKTEIIECKSTMVLTNGTYALYKCSVELPVGFGYPGILSYSVYGFINNGGYFRGYTSIELEKEKFSFYTNTDFDLVQPIITSNDKSYSGGTTLVLFGNSFKDGSTVQIKYFDSSIQTYSPTAQQTTSSYMIVTGIKPTNSLILLKITTPEGDISNEYSITPKIFDINYEPIIPTETPTDSPTDAPTDTPTQTPTPTETPTSKPTETEIPLVTNAPQKCVGSPVCGGGFQGYCSDTGCICYSPWIGLGCTSQVIVVPNPNTNNTDPSIEIPITGGENNGNGGGFESTPPDILFRSLISLVAIREFDFNNIEVKRVTFDKWISKSLTDKKNEYFTNFLIESEIVNVTVILEWFSEKKTIEFAGQSLLMNPSTIKYTISISKYPFQTGLNTLELVMSATLASLKDHDQCSSQQFGDTSSGDNSNFLKIQVDKNSLYGRFVKRGNIDSKFVSIGNQLLDSSFNQIKNTASTQQSYIGIEIPNYKTSCLLDPDFSVLLDLESNESNENAICKSTPKSGLTTAQLTGIIIGSVGFASVIIISVVYSITRKKNQKKFLKNIQVKLNSNNL